VRDFEPVSLFADQLTKETVIEIEKLADTITGNKSSAGIKKAIVKGIPRQAVLKPSHATYRLQNQHFALGDRVVMVQDSGGVPLSVKGVVIGLNSKSMDIVWDVAFMSGVTMGDRCSQYRGSAVDFDSCLNLTNPQFVVSTNPNTATSSTPQSPFKPRSGPYPAVRAPPGQVPAAGFRSAQASQNSPVHIMNNPNRSRGGYINGRGASHQIKASSPLQTSGSETQAESLSVQASDNVLPRAGARGGARGAFHPRGRGRGFTTFDRGRGVPPRGPRGGGRGFAALVPS